MPKSAFNKVEKGLNCGCLFTKEFCKTFQTAFLQCISRRIAKPDVLCRHNSKLLYYVMAFCV